MPATEDHSVRFHQYHLQDMGRVRVRKYCEVEDREVPQQEIGKGYALTKDQIVPVLDEELRELPLPTARAIEIVAFVPAGSIDPLRIGEGYYLQASGTVAAKPYALLRKALARTSKVAVAKFAWHGRERWVCCGCGTRRWCCTRCAGRTRSGTRPNWHRRTSGSPTSRSPRHST